MASFSIVLRDLSKIKRIGPGLRLAKPMLVVLGWAISLASISVTAIVQGVIVPHSAQFAAQVNESDVIGVAVYYLAIFGVSIFAGLFHENIGRSLVGFLASYTVAIVITYLVLILPGLLGSIQEVDAEELALAFTFTAFFPFALFVGLIGGLAGASTKDM